MSQYVAPSKRAPRKPEDAAGWFTPVVKLARHLFVEQVHLKRDGGKLHVVLEDPKLAAPAAPAASTSKGKAKPEPGKAAKVAKTGPADKKSDAAKPTTEQILGIDPAQLARMQQALKAALDQHASARSVLRHLCCFEQAFRSKGAACLSDFPLDVLKAALRQLESVVGTQPDTGLTELKACLVVTVMDRDTWHAQVDQGGCLSDFNVGKKLEVTEVSHSDFLRADQQLPPNKPA